MFRLITLIIFILAIAGLGLHYAVLRRSGGDSGVADWWLGKGKTGRVKRPLYWLALSCLLILVITGFGPTIVLGQSMSGLLLMLHLTAAPLFIVALAVLTVLWAHQSRFNAGDWQRFSRLLGRKSSSDASLGEGGYLCQKLAFWLVAALALGVVASIVLSMYPLFGTEGQERLVQIHRYSALLLVVSAGVHTYLLFAAPGKT